jgi:hypothetical protein
MTDLPPETPAPVVAPARGGLAAVDWPTLLGVAGIVAIAISAMFFSPKDSHDIALAAVGALAGWIGHKALAGTVP